MYSAFMATGEKYIELYRDKDLLRLEEKRANI